MTFAVSLGRKGILLSQGLAVNGRMARVGTDMRGAGVVRLGGSGRRVRSNQMDAPEPGFPR